ncbi:RIP metalloprotease RseP [Kovacikia minuta CCNUW1]|uniref:RIP metalloprotease RseP n=1 Tax=Kovacikia minuta TaxID=2931930 RepID=UPI001CC95E25|nr:RIP metalloprotease RseP [Kovacikia minuta]UBF27022.1 RIP metalloprotease RseP [Kovacikia minuta CCNUW1]
MATSTVFSYLPAIAILALLIFVHELGHFMAARLQGIHANRFSIGFGPILWKYQGPETEYALRALPLGGFVGFPDDDPDSTIPPDDPNLLKNRPVLDRAIVISAGVIANLIFAYLVLVVQVGTIGVAEGFNFGPGVLVPEVVSVDSPAARGGMKSGDIILTANGQKFKAAASDQEAKSEIESLQKVIQTNPNQPVQITVQRDDQTLDLTVTPKTGPDGKGQVGVRLAANGTPIFRAAKNPFEVLSLAARNFQNICLVTVEGFGKLITNFRETAGQVSGPVNIVRAGAKLASDSNSSGLFFYTALISINLAIINILPLPALDGGHLAFLLFEGVRGKPLPTRIQDGATQTGLMLLLGLGIFLIVRELIFQ